MNFTYLGEGEDEEDNMKLFQGMALKKFLKKE